MKRLIYSLAFFACVAASTPAFAQQSGNLRVEFQDLVAIVPAPMGASAPCTPPRVRSS